MTIACAVPQTAKTKRTPPAHLHDRQQRPRNPSIHTWLVNAEPAKKTAQQNRTGLSLHRTKANGTRRLCTRSGKSKPRTHISSRQFVTRSEFRSRRLASSAWRNGYASCRPSAGRHCSGAHTIHTQETKLSPIPLQSPRCVIGLHDAIFMQAPICTEFYNSRRKSGQQKPMSARNIPRCRSSRMY